MTTENGRPGPPETSTSIVLLTLAHRVESELSAALAPLGLTVSRLGLLGHIAGVPGASFSDLARMSGITVQSVHTAVKALAGAGLVRDNTARAGSASAIELTPEGARLLAGGDEGGGRRRRPAVRPGRGPDPAAGRRRRDAPRSRSPADRP